MFNFAVAFGMTSKQNFAITNHTDPSIMEASADS
jgi:hypothetical protein